MTDQEKREFIIGIQKVSKNTVAGLHGKNLDKAWKKALKDAEGLTSANTKSKKKKVSGAKKTKVSGADIRVPRKGRPITPEAADASRRGEGIRVKRDIDGGKRLTGWKEAAEKDIKSRWEDFTDRGFETNTPADKRPWNRRFEFPGRAEEAEALEKERRKRISKQNKGGLPKKPKFMKGGSYKGKKHSYAAGGLVKELKI